MKLARLATIFVSVCLCLPAAVGAGSPTRVERVLTAQVTSGDGIYAPFVGDTVTVTIIYDSTLVDSSPGGGIAGMYTDLAPSPNIGKPMGVRIQLGGPGGIDRSTEGVAGTHQIEQLDTEFLDEWSIDTIDILAFEQASITLRGGPDYLLPGTGGLTGNVDIFPPDVCAASATLTLGNFASQDLSGQLGSITYDFRAGQGCSGVTTTTLAPTTTTTIPTAQGECGDPLPPIGLVGGDAALITATDARFVLSAAVGISSCALCICDVDNSGSITATDALAVLNAALALPVTLNCPPCS